MEDYENQASPQSAFDAFGLGGREANGASSFVSSSDEERKSAGHARVLQRRGRAARVRELEKMAESMPEEAKRLSAVETKSVARKTLELHATCVHEFCDWSGLSADSNVEALEVDRLVTEFMNLLFSEGHRAWKGEKLLASVLFFFPTFSQLEGNRLARSFRALKGWRQASPSFSRRTLLAAVWSALAVDLCRIGGTLAAVLTLVMFEAYLRPGEMLSLKPLEILGTDGGGVRSWVILLFPQAGTARSKTRDADDTISLDSKRCLWMGPVFERLQQRQPQDKVLLNLHCAEYLLLLRRAAANLQVDMVPYQGRHSGASVDRAENLRTLESMQEPRTMEISQVCAPLREKRTCQPKLVRARSIGPGTMRAQQHPPALSIASRSRLSDTASTAPSFVIDLRTPICNSFS